MIMCSYLAGQMRQPGHHSIGMMLAGLSALCESAHKRRPIDLTRWHPSSRTINEPG